MKRQITDLNLKVGRDGNSLFQFVTINSSGLMGWKDDGKLLAVHLYNVMCFTLAKFMAQWHKSFTLAKFTARWYKSMQARGTMPRFKSQVCYFYLWNHEPVITLLNTQSLIYKSE